MPEENTQREPVTVAIDAEILVQTLKDYEATPQVQRYLQLRQTVELHNARMREAEEQKAGKE